MQIRNLFLSACLLAATFLQASPNPIFTPENPIPTSLEESCNLPAPTNFKVDAWGPGWVQLSWDLTNPYHQHRINAYSCKDSSLVKTFIIPGGITDTTLFFPPNPNGDDLYFFEIKAICFSGDSPNSAWTHCIDITQTGLILDLVVSGYIPDIGVGNCTLSPGSIHGPLFIQKCYFNNSAVSTFRIRQHSNWVNSENFCIQRIYNPRDNNAPHYELDPLEQNDPEDPDPEDYTFFVNNQDPDATGGSEYQIKHHGRVVARFIANTDDFGESFLQRVYIADWYEIVRISTYEFGTNPGTGGRSDQVVSTTHDATAAPNPFTETLDVYPGKPSAENIRLQLYNLSGQKVLDQQFPGGQVQYTLATAGFSTGFYLLRIEADGEVQTLKVIKSE